MMIKNRGAGVELLAAKSFSCQAISFNQPTSQPDQTLQAVLSPQEWGKEGER